MREKECNEKEIGISIIVPVYNVEKYLAICIRSLLAQSYKNIEIILVDDGSTDTSGAICDKFAAQSSKIQVIHKKNGGLSSARNAGLAMAGGRYIGFVDSDDYVLPTMYEKLMDAVQKYQAQIVSCKYFSFKEESTPQICIKNHQKESIGVKICSKQQTLKAFFLHGISESVCDKLYQSELLEDYRFAEGEINEDTTVIFSLLKKSSKTVIVDQKLYGYRTRQGSITKSGYSDKFKVVETHLNEIKQVVMKDYPKLLPYFKHFSSIHYYCLLTSILHETYPRQYLKDYKKYRNKFRFIFTYFFKWEKRSVKKYLLGLFLINPTSEIYIKRKR